MKLKINFAEAFDLYHYTIDEAKTLFKESNVDCDAYKNLKLRDIKLRKYCQRAFPKDRVRGFDYCLNKFNFETGQIKYEISDHFKKKTKRGYYYQSQNNYN